MGVVTTRSHFKLLPSLPSRAGANLTIFAKSVVNVPKGTIAMVVVGLGLD